MDVPLAHSRRRDVIRLMIIVAVVVLQSAACLSRLEKRSMPAPDQPVYFQLASGQVIIQLPTLEQIKLALQSYVDSPQFPARLSEVRAAMREELQRAAPWIEEGKAGIGAWKLEDRDGMLTLVRYPPPSEGRTILYLASLAPAGSEWRVTSIEQEREFGRG